jgi:hypothetical protein
MVETSWTEQDTIRALEYWKAYQATHDISDRIGQAVGIDPVEGHIWFGSDALDVTRKKTADGVDRPLYLLRVGKDYYLRKGGRR